MIKKFISISTALAIIIILFPTLHGKDVSLTGIRVRDNERYYHRLKEMRRKNPQDPELSYQLGNLYYSLQMEDEAIKEYKRTLKNNPQHSYAKYFLSKLLVNKGYYEEAFWLVRDLISRHQGNPSLYLMAGNILVKMDQKKSASEYFAKHSELTFRHNSPLSP